ncbi:paraneoplastic antigen Ma1 homolog [Denticeps clupeoides]|uniref:paraneoplastic antigen Ma1 homolog n=1 Tax=Denticeps clupeoides TaxID=299321 RepID=UPI0010A34BA1|nr:paraneoplastic antigen Ma1 homolog [Denticeps clupeoides]
MAMEDTHPPVQADFQTKLLTFLASEGKTLMDVKGLVNSASPSSAAPDLNTQLVNAISSLVEKCHTTPSENQSYRKLRIFSGVKPTPHGEEEYEAWADQTAHMLDEWKCVDSMKKQRIAESLKGPAADIVRCLRISNPNATANDYLTALETAYGTTENATDLMLKFRNTYQLEGEKLSLYLLRIDKLLHSVLRKGGLHVADMDKTRIEQVVRGSLVHDLVALRVRMTYKLKPAPTFTELLRDVREEEDLIMERPGAKCIAASTTVASMECKSVSGPALKLDSSSAAAEKDLSLEKLTREMQGLKTEVTRLLSLSVSSPSLDAQAPPWNTGKNVERRPSAKVKFEKQEKFRRDDVFCYKCGEDGHFQRECQNPENLRKVNKRLLKLRQPSGNFTGAQ